MVKTNWPMGTLLGPPPRIIRFVESNIVTLDVANNVLRIGKALWDRLDPTARHILERVTPEDIKRWR